MSKTSGNRTNPATTAMIVFFIAALGIASFLVVRGLRLNYAEKLFSRSPYYSDCVETPLENVAEVKFYTGNLAVYIEKSTGRKGLMRLDGKKLGKAEYTDFTFVDNGWHNTICIAKPVGEEYPKYVKVAEERVDIKQYQGGTGNPQTVMWSNSTKTLSIHDSTGYSGDLTADEIQLPDGVYAVTDGKKYGYVDEWLDLVIPLDYEKAVDFSDGCGAFLKDGKWGFVNEKGEEILPPVFSPTEEYSVMNAEPVFGFRQGTAPVKKDGLMGVIDKNGKTVVDFVYDLILPGCNGKFIARREGTWLVIQIEKVPESETVTYSDADSAQRLQAGSYRISTSGSSLNLRSTPSQSGEVLAKIPNGTAVTVTKSNVGWAFVKYNGIDGWVSSDYLTETEAPETTAESTSEQTQAD